MLRDIATNRENRTPETAAHFGDLFREIEQDSAKVREMRSSVFITFPDEEFGATESPLLDSGVQAYLNALFQNVPELLYFLSDIREAATPMLCAAAFCPGALVPGDGDAVNLAVTEDFMEVFAQLLVNAADLAVKVGQNRELVLTHTHGFDEMIRTAFRDVVIASVPQP